MIHRVLFSSASGEWGTPQALFNALDAEFHFDLDAAATSDNRKCTVFIDKARDALACKWVELGRRIFCNPPYGSGIGAWFGKAREAQASGALVVLLVPARTDTRYWHAHVIGQDCEVRFLKGRIKFEGGKHSAPFPSALVIYRPIFVNGHGGTA